MTLQACQVPDAVRQASCDQLVIGFDLLAPLDTQLLLTGFEPAPLPRAIHLSRTRSHGIVLLDKRPRRRDLLKVY